MTMLISPGRLAVGTNDQELRFYVQRMLPQMQKWSNEYFHTDLNRAVRTFFITIFAIGNSLNAFV